MAKPPKRLFRKRGNVAGVKLKGGSGQKLKTIDDKALKLCSDRDNAVLDVYFNNGFYKKGALLACGYTPLTAGNTGQFFDRPHIKREIAKRRAAMKDKLQIDDEAVLQQYASIAFSNFGDLMEKDENGNITVDLSSITEHMKAAVSEFTIEQTTQGRGEDAVPVQRIKLKTHSKTEALSALAKYLGLFSDSVKLVADQSLVDALTAGRQRVRGGRPAVIEDAAYEDVTPGQSKALPALEVDDYPSEEAPRVIRRKNV